MTYDTVIDVVYCVLCMNQYDTYASGSFSQWLPYYTVLMKTLFEIIGVVEMGEGASNGGFGSDSIPLCVSLIHCHKVSVYQGACVWYSFWFSF